MRRSHLAAAVVLIASSFVALRARADDGLAPARVLAPAERARLAAKAPRTSADARYLEMTPMGAAAAGILPGGEADGPPAKGSARLLSGRSLAPLAATQIGGLDKIMHSVPANASQAETSIAMNTAGTVLLAGYNDARGFNQPAATGRSLSGIVRSTDGGATWIDGPTFTSGGFTYPVLPSVANGQVFGDPEIKYDPVSNRWLYASIYVRPSDSLQGMCVHRSTDDGATWTTPIEVGPTFVAANAADKEFMDIDPATGKIIISWTNFPNAGSASIRTTLSTDGGLTWSPATTVGTPFGSYTGVQSSVPRFGPGNSVYVTWRVTGGGIRNTAFSRSTDGGLTWSAQGAITANYTPEDDILGIDRVNNSPSMAVDIGNGNVYVVYQANNSLGEGDVGFQRSTDGGLTFSSRVLLDANPGSDRAQFYPAVTVDQGSHRVHVIWYDQGAGAGDVTEVMHSFSTDGGATWSRSTPLSDRPFHASYGNDGGQPNMGDYNQCVAGSGKLHSTFAGTSVAPQFNEGVPSGSMDTPDAYYDQTLDTQNVAALRLGTPSFSEGCVSGQNTFLDPGETVSFTVPLRNYTSGLGAATFNTVSATLSTATPGVSIGTATSSYPDIAAGGTQNNATAFSVTLANSPTFTAGTYIDFLLTVTATDGGTSVVHTTQLPFRMATGTPSPSPLLSENFDGVAAGTLPAGWASANSGGTAGGLAWTTSSTFGFGSNAAFHGEQAAPTNANWMRLQSPTFNVPTPGAGVNGYVTLDFDVYYKLEHEPTQAIRAYDGLTVRLSDNGSSGAPAFVRSVWAEAVAEQIKVATSDFFPKHILRSNATGFFQDVSCFSGDSAGVRHVTMKFPGAGMYGRQAYLRFDYTEDTSGDCTGAGMAAPCGVAIDNVVVNFVTATTSTCTVPVTLMTFDAQ